MRDELNETFPKKVVDAAYTAWAEHARDYYIDSKMRTYDLAKLMFICGYLRCWRDGQPKPDATGG